MRIYWVLIDFTYHRAKVTLSVDEGDVVELESWLSGEHSFCFGLQERKSKVKLFEFDEGVRLLVVGKLFCLFNYKIYKI